jgi:hypothetical protein
MHLQKRYNKDKIKEIAKDFEFMTSMGSPMINDEAKPMSAGGKTMHSWAST